MNKILNFLASFGEKAFTTALIRDAMAVSLLSPPSAGLPADTAPATPDVIRLPERERVPARQAA